MHTRIQRRAGLALMVVSVVGAALMAGPAAAQDGETANVPIDHQALFTYPANDAVPDTLLASFPPVVVCVVEPRLCPESAEPVRNQVGGALGEVNDNQETLPIQPASPDGLTVTFYGGSPRYASGAEFALPDIPDGHQYDEFVLQFPQGQPSFDFNSPAFRRAVTAVIQTAASQDPEVFQEQLGKLLEEEPEGEEPLMAIEACPLTKAMPDDAAPPQSAPVRTIEEENADGEFEPAINCLYGANGSFADGAWSFDLTLAARAWSDGTLENHGILLRPTGAPNLAFGDPDTSTNAQVVLDISEAPTAVVASSEPPPPVAPLGDGFAPPSGTTSGTSSQPPLSGGTSGGGFSSSVPSTTPQSAPPAQVAEPQTTPQDQPVAAPPSEPASSPAMPWHVWLLVPVFAAGIWLTATSLTAGVAVATTRHGALSRLTGGAA